MPQKKSAVMPELLSPAGSMESLCAAIQAGADAVYFGGSIANARANAKNLSDDEVKTAVELLHEHNKRSYITLNTLHTDRELASPQLLKFIEHCLKCGADAFILQDIGLSVLIKHFFPDIELHASTQMASHSLNAAKELAELGFSRMVIARELDKKNLNFIIKNSPIEIEMFVHGALCSSHSGRCFMSFALGNTRSANRGMCAQPCRLKYNNNYLLSLKDLCLAHHMEEIIELKPASLKIEGRMKPPEYVYNVTKIYRRCLDEGRNANKKEIDFLSQVFSRQGFTDGYFRGSIGAHMYGVRTETDKSKSRDIRANNSYTPAPQLVAGNLHGGGYVYKADADVIQGIREFILKKSNSRNTAIKEPKLCLNFGSFKQFAEVSEFLLKKEIYNKIYKIFIPITELNGRIKSVDKNLSILIGGRLPYVILDSEENTVYRMLENIIGNINNTNKKFTVMTDNIGHIKIAERYNCELFGNFGLNITNSISLEELEKMGFRAIILSPELKFAQIRDIVKSINCGIVSYGRINVMISENCLIRNGSLCRADTGANRDIICGSPVELYKFSLKDRLGEKFPVTGDFGHRSIVFNSVPVYLADKKSLYTNLGLFFAALNFTCEKRESIEKIIREYAVHGESAKSPVKFTRGYK